MKRRVALILSLLLSASPLWAAVGVNGVAVIGVTGSPGIATSLTTGGADRVLVACLFLNFEGSSVTSFTYGGQTLTFVDREQNNNGVVVEMWRLINPPIGPNSLAAEVDIGTNMLLGGVNFTGAHQSAPLGTPVATQGTGDDPATLDVTGAADGMVLDCLMLGPGLDVPTLGAGQTSQFSTDNGDGTVWAAASTEAGSGTRTMSWSDTFCCYNAHIGVLISPAPAGPGGGGGTRRRGGPMVPR